MSCPVQRHCSEILLSDLIEISWETWVDIHALSTGVVVVKKWAVSVYNLKAAEEEEALSSLIVWLDLTCMTYLVWSRVIIASVTVGKGFCHNLPQGLGL